jgi:hypothetical protein
MTFTPELMSALVSAAGLSAVAFIVTNKTILRWVDSLSKPKGR